LSCLSPQAPARGPALLHIAQLAVTYPGQGQSGPAALRGVDLDIAAGEAVGILGESGCGKSTLALSILGLLPAAARVEGSIELCSRQLLGLPERDLRAIRGAKISLIHQEPGLCLSPVMPVGRQIAEVIRAHRPLPRKQLRQEVEAILEEVRLPDARRIAQAYPHQLSGGELSRVVIAQALACRPVLIIADEPTRSLDLRIQAEIVDLFRDLHQRCATAILFITHNPALLAGFADRVIVMHEGQVAEDGEAKRVFCQPSHAYTKSLLQLVPHAMPAAQRVNLNSQAEPLHHGC